LFDQIILQGGTEKLTVVFLDILDIFDYSLRWDTLFPDQQSIIEAANASIKGPLI